MYRTAIVAALILSLSPAVELVSNSVDFPMAELNLPTPEPQPAPQQSAPLAGIVFILDSGHGGADKGATVEIDNNGQPFTVFENEYAYDVTLRLKALLEELGGIVVLTVIDDDQPVQNQRLLEEDRSERFTSTGHRVDNHVWGLVSRLMTANRVNREYPDHEKVYLSIHFDSCVNERWGGVHFIGPEGQTPKVVEMLKNHFGEAGLLRDYQNIPAVMENADPRIGRKFVLNGPEQQFSGWYNRIKQRAILELGYLTNEGDLERILSPEYRDYVARLIAEAMISYSYSNDDKSQRQQASLALSFYNDFDNFFKKV